MGQKDQRHGNQAAKGRASRANLGSSFIGRPGKRRRDITDSPPQHGSRGWWSPVRNRTIPKGRPPPPHCPRASTPPSHPPEGVEFTVLRLPLPTHGEAIHSLVRYTTFPQQHAVQVGHIEGVRKCERPEVHVKQNNRNGSDPAWPRTESRRFLTSHHNHRSTATARGPQSPRGLRPSQDRRE